jgi:hypothetical protein
MRRGEMIVEEIREMMMKSRSSPRAHAQLALAPERISPRLYCMACIYIYLCSIVCGRIYMYMCAPGVQQSRAAVVYMKLVRCAALDACLRSACSFRAWYVWGCDAVMPTLFTEDLHRRYSGGPKTKPFFLLFGTQALWAYKVSVWLSVSPHPFLEHTDGGPKPTNRFIGRRCRNLRRKAAGDGGRRRSLAARQRPHGLPEANRGSPADKAARCRHDGRESLAQATAPGWAVCAVSTPHEM